jgi:hypothetical protein
VQGLCLQAEGRISEVIQTLVAAAREIGREVSTTILAASSLNSGV